MLGKARRRLRPVRRTRNRIHGKNFLLLLGSLGLMAFLAMSTEALVRGRLSDDIFAAPTRFYARPLVFQSGMSVDRSRVERTLTRLGYRQARRSNVAIGEYYFGSRRWVIGRRAFRHYDQVDPGGVAVVRLGWRGHVWGVEDADGNTLPHLALEPELIRSLNSTNEDRVPVRLDAVPKHLVDAVLTIEDQHFFEHHGLDARRIAGAAIANARARRIEQGASTLTQQLVKNLFLSSTRSPIRKLRELAIALVVERRHTKNEILEAYLNQVYLGQDGALAIHGVGRASQYFFNKDVSQLALHEAALLAGIVRGPSMYSPLRNPDAATGRRNLVLALMESRDLISPEAGKRARALPLGVRRNPGRARNGRYFVDYVSATLQNDHGDDFLRDGVSVFTTLDMDMQRAAEDAVREGLARLERDYPPVKRTEGPLQAALVALNPRTGEILAMVGGRDYGQSQFNRAVNARRQPGSSFKPIVALAALTQPAGEITLATMLDDEPLSVETPAGLWTPANYDNRFRGSITLREALERSLNVPFARLGMTVGPKRIVETARKLGIESRLNPVFSLALGSSEVTPLEMTRAFGVLAAEGQRSELNATLGVLAKSGAVLSPLELESEQAFDPAEAYLLTSALRGAVERGTGRALRSRGFRGAVAAKSGTTNDFRDAWFIGYTPTLAVGVWVGFDNGRTVGLPGSRAALPIFARFLVGSLGTYGGDEDFSMPYGVEVVEIDRDTGLRAGWGCRGEPEVFLRGTAPERSCSRFWDEARRVASSSRWYQRVAPVLEDLRRRFERSNRRGN